MGALFRRFPALIMVLVSLLSFADYGDSIELPVTAIELISDSELVIATDEGLFVVDATTLKTTREIKTNLEKIVCIQASSDKSWLAVAGGTPAESGLIEIYSLPDLKLIRQYDWEEDVVTDLAWYSNSELAACNMDGACCRLNIAEASIVGSSEVHSKPVHAIVSLDNKLLVSAGADNVIKTWEDPRVVVRSLNNHTAPVNGLAIRPSTETNSIPSMVSVSEDSTVRLWQPTIGRMVRFVRLKSVPNCVSWNSDGSLCMAGCQDSTLQIVDLEQAKIVGAMKCQGWINCCALSADGKSLFVGTVNGLEKVQIAIGKK